MNHAASELGLSTEVAQNLYTHRVNPAVVNLLLTNATFINVLNRLTLYFDEVFAAGFAMHNQQIEKLSSLVMSLGTPAAEQTAQTVDLLKEPIYQADETTLQNEFLTAIRQIKAKVGENRAAQTACSLMKRWNRLLSSWTRGSWRLSRRWISTNLPHNCCHRCRGWRESVANL